MTNDKPFHVTYSVEASHQIAELDGGVRVIILKWIQKHLENTLNPRASGKALDGELAGLWRYRVGDYRLLCQIKDTEVEIFIVKIGHRRDAYVFRGRGGRNKKK